MRVSSEGGAGAASVSGSGKGGSSKGGGGKGAAAAAVTTSPDSSLGGAGEFGELDASDTAWASCSPNLSLLNIAVRIRFLLFFLERERERQKVFFFFLGGKKEKKNSREISLFSKKKKWGKKSGRRLPRGVHHRRGHGAGSDASQQRARGPPGVPRGARAGALKLRRRTRQEEGGGRDRRREEERKEGKESGRTFLNFFFSPFAFVSFLLVQSDIIISL